MRKIPTATRATSSQTPVLALQRCIRPIRVTQGSRSSSSLSQWDPNRLRSRPSFLTLQPRPNAFTHRRLQFEANISITAASAPAGRSLATKLKNLLCGASLVLFLGLGWYYVTDTRASVHRWLAVPALRWWYRDAEEAHEAGTKTLRALWELGLNPREREKLNGGMLEIKVSCSDFN